MINKHDNKLKFYQSPTKADKLKKLEKLGVALILISVALYFVNLIYGIATFNAGSTNVSGAIMVYIIGGIFVIGVILVLIPKK